jgi:preprotein translocase subunit SecE
MSTKPEAEKQTFLPAAHPYLRDTRGELKKVVWPSKKQIFNNTAIVIGVVVLASLLVCGLDAVLSAVVRLLFGS